MKFCQPILVCAALTATAFSQAATLQSLEQKASYAYGIDIIKNLKAQGIEIDLDAFVQGMKDSQSGASPALSDMEMRHVKNQHQIKARERRLAELERIASENLAKGQAFLAENAKKPGVVTTASGLQYKIIKPGTGKTPTLDDTVVTHYRGTLIDGREFDSSYQRNQPATFPVKGVIKGWTEALQLMKEGAKWELYIPAELAYGKARRSELIQPNSTLLFEIELLEVK